MVNFVMVLSIIGMIISAIWIAIRVIMGLKFANKTICEYMSKYEVNHKGDVPEIVKERAQEEGLELYPVKIPAFTFLTSLLLYFASLISKFI